MNLRLPLLFLTLFFCQLAFAQWSTNPSVNNIIFNGPSSQLDHTAVSDGANGLISIFYESNGTTQTISAQRISGPTAALLWGTTTSAKSVCSVASAKDYLTAIPDGSGGAFIAWTDERFSSTYSEVFIQRINSNGDAQWTAGGVRVTNTAALDESEIHLCADGSGGVIICWAWDDKTSNIQSSAQRYNSAGVAQWATAGVQISTVPGFRIATSLMTDGAGGVIVGLIDTRNDPNGTNYAAINASGGTNIDVFAQRLSSSGSLQWTASGVAICTATGNQGCLNATLPDGSGGAYLVIDDYRNNTAPVGSNPNNEDVYAQRINASGVVQWTPNGVPVTTAAGFQYPEAAIVQSSGALLVVWTDDLGTSTREVAQSISTTGTQQWATTGVVISGASGTYVDAYTPSLCLDGAGNVIVAMEVDNTSNSFILAQQITPTGTLNWGTGGRILSDAGDPYQPYAISSNSGAAVVSFKKYNSTTLSDIFAAKTDATGTCTLPGQPAAIANDSRCAGAPATYTVTPVSGATGYNWSVTPSAGVTIGGQGTGTVSIQFPVVTVSTDFTVSVAAINTCGTGTARTFTVTVKPLPVAPVVTPPVVFFCAGNSAVLTANTTTPNQWYKDGVIISGAITNTYTVTVTGTYTVKTTGANGCESPLSNAVVVTVNAIPTTPTITLVGDSLVSSATTGNQWYFNGTSISGATGQKYKPTQTGIYTVQVTQNGCNSPTSAGFTFTITAVTNVSALPQYLKLWPNPVKNKLTVVQTGAPLALNLRLLDMNGKLLKTMTTTAIQTEVDMTGYAAGSYILWVENKAKNIQARQTILKL